MTPTDEAALHRKLAVALFNNVWDLLERKTRTIQEDDTMLHAAHASRYHWGVVGEPVNLARGEWQVSHVYAILGRGEPALYHARRSLEICGAHGIGDFDLAYAHEAVARAAAIIGDEATATEHLALARASGAAIANEDDRAQFLNDLATMPAV